MNNLAQRQVSKPAAWTYQSWRCSLVTLLEQLADNMSLWVDGKSLEHRELSTLQHLASLSTRAMWSDWQSHSWGLLSHIKSQKKWQFSEGVHFSKTLGKLAKVAGYCIMYLQTGGELAESDFFWRKVKTLKSLGLSSAGLQFPSPFLFLPPFCLRRNQVSDSLASPYFYWGPLLRATSFRVSSAVL